MESPRQNEVIEENKDNENQDKPKPFVNRKKPKKPVIDPVV